MARPSPVAMTRAEIEAFVAAGDLAVIAVPTAGGGLDVRVTRYGADGGNLVLAGPVPPAAGACALVDTYPAYDRIQGAILRGAVTATAGGARFETRTASGFDFTKLANP
jgi:hypothetical protein